MSEEQVTENSEDTESTEEVAPQTTPEEQYVNTRPEHIPEKFWTNDGVDVDEMAKSYNELEKYVGGKKDDYKDEIMEELANEHMQDVPENYELPKLPEGITEDMVAANPMSDWWSNHCKENNYSQEEYEDGINAYVDGMLGNQPNLEQEYERLGENAEARLDAVDSWASTFFAPEEYETIQATLGTSAEGIEALERIMESQSATSRSDQVAQPDRQLTLGDVKEMMKDPRYYDDRYRDANFVKKVNDAFSRLYR